MTDQSDVIPALLASTTQQKVEVSSTVTGGVAAVFGLLSARPAAGGVAGTIFWATDQVALYLSDGVNWIRIGEAAGNIIWTNEATARTGYVLLTGQAWPATTGIYADLFALWGGSNLPDVQGRALIAKGAHVDVATLLANDGQAAANRRPKHRTSLTDPGHTHGAVMSDVDASGAGWFAFRRGGGVSATQDTGTQNASTGITVGSGNANDASDTPSYIVLQPQAKL